MYAYFFLSGALPRRAFTTLVKPLGPLITLVQIAQMAAFIAINVAVAGYVYGLEVCAHCCTVLCTVHCASSS